MMPNKGAFQVGHPRLPGAGRKPGGLNHRTVEVKTVLEEAARKMGGVKGLVEWARSSPENTTTFWRDMWLKLLPLSATIRADVQHELAPKSAEELAAALEAHGLPALVFGLDKPVLELPGTLAGGPVLDAEPLERSRTVDEAEVDEASKINRGEDNRGEE
jgi:hypothetical protein